MITINVYDGDFSLVGIIEKYKSLIWANRYAEVGDCEIYLEATTENLNLLQKNRFVSRDDDEMVCQIKKVEIDTDVENGNYLIVTGIDVKHLCDQRIIWGTSVCYDYVQDFVRMNIYDAFIGPTNPERKLVTNSGRQMLYLGARDPNITDMASEQVSYANVGEKIREYCQRYGWGYKIKQIRDGSLLDKYLEFVIYVGTDRSAYVKFSPEYENINTTKYQDDITNIANVALIGGVGEGASRVLMQHGEAIGVNRYEIFVDAKNEAKTMTWGELSAAYPPESEGGQGYFEQTPYGYYYRLRTAEIRIPSRSYANFVTQKYPDTQFHSIGDDVYVSFENLLIAVLDTNQPEPSTSCELDYILYLLYLDAKGADTLSQFAEVISFEGDIGVEQMFHYREDYFLGDIVEISNSMGFSIAARITEVIEVDDENGYSIQPKYEYLNTLGIPFQPVGLTTESLIALTTEDGKVLMTEF